MTLATISNVIATDLRRFEQSINGALRDGATLLVTLIDGGKQANLAADVLHPAIIDVTTTLGTIASGQSAIALQAHPKLAKVGRRLGLSETNWGSSGSKAEDLSPAPSAELASA